jgi:hypothetical protein
MRRTDGPMFRMDGSSRRTGQVPARPGQVPPFSAALTLSGAAGGGASPPGGRAGGSGGGSRRGAAFRQRGRRKRGATGKLPRRRRLSYIDSVLLRSRRPFVKPAESCSWGLRPLLRLRPPFGPRRSSCWERSSSSPPTPPAGCRGVVPSRAGRSISLRKRRVIRTAAQVCTNQPPPCAAPCSPRPYPPKACADSPALCTRSAIPWANLREVCPRSARAKG